MRIHSRHLALALAAAGALALGTAVPSAGAGAKWSDSGATGPAHWASLDPAYAACSDGRAQSPVNLRQVTRKPLRNPRFHYVTSRAAVFNNTHTVEAKARPGSTMTVGGTTFRLLQIHFHVHSEHEVNGHVYPVEVHLHQTRTGDLAALGVFVRRGSSTNRAWQPYVRSLDVAPGKTVHRRIDWAAMLPRDRESFRYPGSVTTPPCTEPVTWVVLRTRSGSAQGRSRRSAPPTSTTTGHSSPCTGARSSSTPAGAADLPSGRPPQIPKPCLIDRADEAVPMQRHPCDLLRRPQQRECAGLDRRPRDRPAVPGWRAAQRSAPAETRRARRPGRGAPGPRARRRSARRGGSGSCSKGTRPGRGTPRR